MAKEYDIKVRHPGENEILDATPEMNQELSDFLAKRYWHKLCQYLAPKLYNNFGGPVKRKKFAR